MVANQPRPEMSFGELVSALTEAGQRKDRFEGWLMDEIATNKAMASEHQAGCEHHVRTVTLERTLEKYRAMKESTWA